MVSETQPNEDENVQWFTVLLKHPAVGESVRIEQLSAFDDHEAASLAIGLAADRMTSGNKSGWTVENISLEAKLKLKDAWFGFGWAQDNLAFVQKFVDELGIERFEVKATYIKAIRKGIPALAIFYGSTVGFMGETEARKASQGLTDFGRDQGAKADRWWVHHPSRKPSGGGGRQSRPIPDYGACPNPDCSNFGVKLPATGACDECGYDAFSAEE